MERISKENYYLDIAQTVLERATCLRRIYGAIIVKNDEIISTGYNGAPRGRRNCVDMGYCTREALRVPRGERYELCRSVHAEGSAGCESIGGLRCSSVLLMTAAYSGDEHIWRLLSSVSIRTPRLLKLYSSASSFAAARTASSLTSRISDMRAVGTGSPAAKSIASTADFIFSVSITYPTLLFCQEFRSHFLP